MNYTEKQIENHILSLSEKQLQEENLYLFDNRFSQVNLGAYGIADIVCFNTDISDTLFIQVVEIKKEKIGIKTLLQASRYANGIKRIASQIKSDLRVDIEIILIGESIENNSDFCHLVEFFQDNVTLYEFTINATNTIEFSIKSGYKKINNSNKVISNHIINTIVDFCL